MASRDKYSSDGNVLTPHQQRQGRVMFLKRSLASAAALITLLWLCRSRSTSPTTRSTSTMSENAEDGLMDDVEIQGNIEWRRCLDDSQFWCSRLEVPLEYSNPLNTRRVAIALRKLPALCESKKYLGALLVNPGGPGGSGCRHAQISGPVISEVVNGRYDIVGFDPRGVGLTTPSFGCSQNAYEAGKGTAELMLLPSPLEGRKGDFMPMSSGPTNLENAIYNKKFAMLKSLVDGCLQKGDLEMIRSASTATAARDMASIISALQQEKLHYWGLSYGTALGSTFAAMFPERVGRMVLDGTMDVKSYTTNFRDALTSLSDNDKVLKAMSEQCGAHAHMCALATPLWPVREAVTSQRTPDAFIKNIEYLARNLSASPLPVPTSRYGPGILTATALQRNLHRKMYWPAAWPRFASWVAEAIAGNGTSLYEAFASEGPAVVQTAKGDSSRSLEIPKDLYEISEGNDWLPEAMINCLDSGIQPARTREDRIEYARSLAKISHIGDYWAHIGWFLDECKVTAKEAYHGPWTRQSGLRKTATPLLYIGNTADNVTPMKYAFEMAESFGHDSATVLQHDGYGHTSLAQPSLCTAKTVRSFLTQGILPEFGTLCPVQKSWPFVPFDYSKLDEPDALLLKSLEKLANIYGGVTS